MEGGESESSTPVTVTENNFKLTFHKNQKVKPYTVTKTIYTTIRRKKRYPYRHCAFMSNFTLRFVYECFFEIFLCLLIHVTTAYDSSESLLVFSLILFLLSLGLIALISLLFCFRGPYMEPCVYREKSLKRSFWGLRPLNKRTIEPMMEDDPDLIKDKENLAKKAPPKKKP